MIGNNETARAYNRLQNSIDWATASDESQINVMEIMRQLLIQAASHTVIFTYGEGFPYRTASEQLESVDRRLASFRRKISH